jgi:hypothetical protein
MKNKIISLIIVIIATVNFVNAQTTEIKISLDENFFDVLLEAVFTHLDEPKVPISQNLELEKSIRDNQKNTFAGTDSNSFRQNASWIKDDTFYLAKTSFTHAPSNNICDESIKLKREVDGVRTAVRFRQGKIYAPIAFSGNYNPPLIGCIEFQGWAETNIELFFDKNKNALVGKAKVLKVNLSGTGGIGSSLLARFVQSSIDQKVNPIEIIRLDKLSFSTPVQNSGKIKMNALGIRHKVNDNSLDVFIKYEFLKAK